MRKILASIVVGVLLAGGTAVADDGPQTIVIDLSGLNSWDLQGSPFNDVISVGFQVGDILHSVKWDVSLTFQSPSWAEEVSVSMTDGVPYDVLNTAIYFPGVQSSNPISGGGTFALGDHVMTTTSLDIELHEWNFDDFPGGIDAFYQPGSELRINFTAIPAPGALALIGLAGLVSRRRRRA